jgi:CDP-paratose 2-epimerase
MPATDRVANLSGGTASAMSLAQLTAWCDEHFGAHPVTPEPTPRPFDIPWIVLDHGKATRLWRWRPQLSTVAILDEIAAHARAHPEWLDISAPL